MKQITLDGNILADAEKIHDYLKKALDLPAHYGNNLDALYDCLGDLEDLEITITTPKEFDLFYLKVVRVFNAADRGNDSLNVIYLDA